MVTSKRKFDFEGSYLKRLGESIALLLHIIPHKVKLDPRSIKNPMLRLDCAGTLPPRARCSQLGQQARKRQKAREQRGGK